jgi:hypothetical protein
MPATGWKHRFSPSFRFVCPEPVLANLKRFVRIRKKSTRKKEGAVFFITPQPETSTSIPADNVCFQPLLQSVWANIHFFSCKMAA